MRVLDLFSGIGGFALAGQWVWGDDHRIVGFCEIDEYCHKVLNKNFPGVPIYEDIQQLNGKDFNDIDLITGGFPCQDISVAGKGAGIEEGTRSGLWFEMLRIISEVRPRFALIENVPMLTIRGGTRVIADLTKIGYDAEWTIIGADDVGAWHKRKRIWIVSYPRCTSREKRSKKQRGLFRQSKKRNSCNKSIRSSKTQLSTNEFSNSNDTRNRTSTSRINKDRKKKNQKRKDISQFKFSRYSKTVSNSDGKRSKVRISKKRYREKGYTEEPNNYSDRQGRRSGKSHWSAKQRVGGMANGLSNRLDRYWIREPEGILRVRAGQTNRVQRLKGLGNAIVPQVAYKVMKMIKDCDE